MENRTILFWNISIVRAGRVKNKQRDGISKIHVFIRILKVFPGSITLGIVPKPRCHGICQINCNIASPGKELTFYTLWLLLSALH